MTLRPIAVAALLLAPSPALATCLLECQVTLSDPSCGDHTGAPYTTSEEIAVHGACEVTCCAPPNEENPNGSCSTEATPMTPDMLVIMEEDGTVVPGAFEDNGELCGMQPLMVYDRTLPAGHYAVVQDGLILAELDVVEDTSGCGARLTGLPVLAGLLLLPGLRRRR